VSAQAGARTNKPRINLTEQRREQLREQLRQSTALSATKRLHIAANVGDAELGNGWTIHQ